MPLLLAEDLFDRSNPASLGSSWGIPLSAQWGTDGDRAHTNDVLVFTGTGTPTAQNSSNLEVYYAIYTATRPADQFGRQTSYRVQVGRPPLNNSTEFQAGLVFNSVHPSNFTAGTITRRNYELFLTTNGPLLVLRSRAFSGATGNVWTKNIGTWNVGDRRSLRVDIGPAIGLGAQADIYLDEVLQTSLTINVNPTSGPALDYNYSGLWCFRQDPGTNSQQAGNGEFDFFRLFDISNTAAAFNVETEPTLVVDPTLTTITVAGEGASTGALALTPDSAYVTDRAYATNRLRTASGHVVRHPRLSNPRRFWTLSWRGRSTADKDSLVAMFDNREGGVGVFTWTPPGGSSTKMAFLESSLSYRPSPSGTAETWDIEAVAVEIF